jgi:uncharacterized protein YbjT (DUF2867 family)
MGEIEKTVAVVGGTGTLGKPLVAELLGRGASVRVLSRNPAGVPDGAEHRRVDLLSGAGLAEALSGVDVVIDSASSQKDAEKTLVGGTRRLLEAGAAAGVSHHVLISIVGIDQVPLGYYKVKVAQEALVADGPVPWSILRATQFPQLLDGAFAAAARFGLRPTGKAKLQPVDPAVVAGQLADAALAAPAGRLPDVAGPEVTTLSELSRAWAKARGKHRLALRVPSLGKAGRALAAGALIDRAATTPGPTFAEWLAHE